MPAGTLISSIVSTGENVENTLRHGEEPAFANTPDPARFFTGARRGALVATIQSCLLHNDAVLAVVGEPGSGKSSICRRLAQDLSSFCDVVYLAHPSLSAEALLRAIAVELALSATAREDKLDLLRRIQEHALARYAQDRRIVLLIEDAQLMSDESLEELRLLINLEGSERGLLQAVLFAQPTFAVRLKTDALCALDDRIARRFTLHRFSLRETRQYLRARLSWTARDEDRWSVSACAACAIYLLSRGRPRRITRLAQGAWEHTRNRVATRIRTGDVARAFLQTRDFQAAKIRPPFAYGFLGSLLAAAGFASGAWLPPAAEQPPSDPISAFVSEMAPIESRDEMRVQSDADSGAPSRIEVATDSASTMPTGAAAADTAALQDVDLSVWHHDFRAAGQTWLASADRKAYTIQLMFCWEDRSEQFEARDALIEQVRAGHLSESLFLVTGAVRDRPASMLMLGQFDSKAQALGALAALPSQLKHFKPFVRRIAQLQRDIFGAAAINAQAAQEARP